MMADFPNLPTPRIMDVTSGDGLEAWRPQFSTLQVSPDSKTNIVHLLLDDFDGREVHIQLSGAASRLLARKLMDVSADMPDVVEGR